MLMPAQVTALSPNLAGADMTQAVYHGVPIIAMPFFGDQPMNAQKVISKVCDKPTAPFWDINLPSQDYQYLHLTTQRAWGVPTHVYQVQIKTTSM